MNTVRIKANAGLLILPNGVEVPNSGSTTDVDLDDATLAKFPVGVIGTFAGTNLVLSIQVKGSSGNFRLNQYSGTTPNLAFNVLAADLKTAIVALGFVASGDLTVTGGPGDLAGTTPYVLTFSGAQAAKPLATWSAEYPGQPYVWSSGIYPIKGIDVSLAGTDHGVYVTTTTPGRAGALMEDVTA